MNNNSVIVNTERKSTMEAAAELLDREDLDQNKVKTILQVLGSADAKTFSFLYELAIRL